MDKWNTLEHNGVLFPQEYILKNVPVIVTKKEYFLSPEAEEMAFAWAQKIETDYVKDKVFQKNFWMDFKSVVPKELKETKFPDDWDFSRMWSFLVKRKEENKNKTKEERDHEKKQKELAKETYGYATINGKKMPLANYVVEPPGMYMGRGSHPLRGRWKTRVRPEDITLNLSKSAPVPPAPKGHSWFKIVENKNALWTSMWIDKLTGKHKLVLFGAASTVRQGADQKKFSKALVLAQKFDEVNSFIEKKMKSKDALTREIATACNLIAKLTIRVGDEKDENEADTVGCTTLSTKHIKINGSEVEFDFLGKDSVRYHNIVSFDEQTIKNLQELIQGKSKDDFIFEHITSHDVNEFLQIVIPGLTAKQFRTAVGSKLLAEKLREKDLSSVEKEMKKVEAYNDANLEVALKLNHQTAVTDAYDTSLKNMKNTLKEVNQELKKLKQEFKEVKEKEEQMKTERIALAKEKWKGERQKEAIRRAKDTYNKNIEKYEHKIERLNERYDNLSIKIGLKEKVKGVALGTSKTNYSDPRIGISWCKKNNVPVEKLYTKTLLEKFSWAQDVDSEFYEKYPNIEE